ncbi:MAG: helix-turn-helix domain-containing protein [Kiloniellaceae bacterium]
MTNNPPQHSAVPDPVDVTIGSRLRLRRLALGFSQDTLARSLGITFQQVQKYERGTNRIFASRLFQLARVLRVPVAFFFQGLPPTGDEAAPERADDATEMQNVQDLLGKSDTLKLIQAYNRINDPTVRRQIYALVKAVGEQDPLAGRFH